ncbi:MAG: hypothetical protein K2G27_02730 [Duncaniella sp.]|nr:hypothetical protein [Duncaniella sp.]
MSRNYNELLKAVYEIEGLLALQVQRGDNAVAAVDDMIADKLSVLAEKFSSVNTTPASEKTEDNVSVATPESVESKLETVSEIVSEPEQVSTCPSESDVTVESEAIADAALEEEREDADIRPANDNMSLTLDEKLARERAQDIFKAFTLNDKFRFRRELFRNSQEEFDDALNIISQMSTIEEAEEYIYDDLCWDPENEDVKAFMDIVTKHF